MPLDPDRVRDLSERAQTLSKRFDAMLERKAINDAAENDEDDDDDDIDLNPLDPAIVATRETPGSDLANYDPEEPWWA